MLCRINIDNKVYQFNWETGIDVSQSFGPGGANPLAFYLPPATREPVRVGDFVGSVPEGGSANCDFIKFCPHGNGTHTECFGHINAGRQSINQNLPNGLYCCQLVSVVPQQIDDDWVITKELIANKISTPSDAVMVRTQLDAMQIGVNWSGSNPPYFAADALEYLKNLGVEHLLTDLPSVDREDDGGKLSAHHSWWNTRGELRNRATITELIYVPKVVADSLYILQIQVAPMECDAAPSRPILFPIKST